MALAATLRVGGRGIPVYSFHLESGLAEGALRAAQAAELAAAATSRPSPRILGGDSNVHGYALDLVLGAGLEPAVPRFEAAGLRDAHRALLPPARSTHLALVVIDLILTDAPTEVSGVGSWTTWGGLSDHFPVWARLRLGADGG
jgi:endonuclease/exonuclease/phosphatase family metal-dependent hydrolase